jgi:Flp pilus assembly protein TadD
MLSKNNPDEAIRMAGQAVKLANRADAHNVLGAAYGYKGDHSRALQHFLEAFRLYPEFPSLRDNIANALMDRGDYRAAAEFCRKSEAEGKSCTNDTQKRINDRE